MPSTASITAFVLMALATAPAVAATPGDEAAADELLVVARSVMPRVAYHALEPTANPVRVQATVFPGRIFHGAMDGLVGRLAGDHELGERAPLAATDAASGLEPGMAGPLGHGPRLEHAGATQGSRAVGGSIGGSVLRATSGIGDRVTQAVLRATSQGAGP